MDLARGRTESEHPGRPSQDAGGSAGPGTHAPRPCRWPLRRAVMAAPAYTPCAPMHRSHAATRSRAAGRGMLGRALTLWYKCTKTSRAIVRRRIPADRSSVLPQRFYFAPPSCDGGRATDRGPSLALRLAAHQPSPSTVAREPYVNKLHLLLAERPPLQVRRQLRDVVVHVDRDPGLGRRRGLPRCVAAVQDRRRRPAGRRRSAGVRPVPCYLRAPWTRANATREFMELATIRLPAATPASAVTSSRLAVPHAVAEGDQGHVGLEQLGRRRARHGAGGATARRERSAGVGRVRTSPRSFSGRRGWRPARLCSVRRTRRQSRRVLCVYASARRDRRKRSAALDAPRSRREPPSFRLSTECPPGSDSFLTRTLCAPRAATSCRRPYSCLSCLSCMSSEGTCAMRLGSRLYTDSHR